MISWFQNLLFIWVKPVPLYAAANNPAMPGTIQDAAAACVAAGGEAGGLHSSLYTLSPDLSLNSAIYVGCFSGSRR